LEQELDASSITEDREAVGETHGDELAVGGNTTPCCLSDGACAPIAAIGRTVFEPKGSDPQLIEVEPSEM